MGCCGSTNNYHGPITIGEGGTAHIGGTHNDTKVTFCSTNPVYVEPRDRKVRKQEPCRLTYG